VRVTESVSGYQKGLGLLRMSDEGRIECLKRFREELIQLEAACDQRCLRRRSEIQRQVGRCLKMVSELGAEIVFPLDPASAVDDSVVHPAMEVVNESPLASLCDTC